MADLSLMTGNDLNKLRIEPLQSRNGEEGSAHCNLMGVRLRYDEMKKNSCLSEARILKQKVRTVPPRNKSTNFRFSKQNWSTTKTNPRQSLGT